MKISGTQFIAELTDCDRRLLDNEDALKAVLLRGIADSGLTHIEMTSHKFSPVGVTLIAIISESHIAIHTFPEVAHASVDIFHCADDTAPLYRLLDFLKTELAAGETKFITVERGDHLRAIGPKRLQQCREVEIQSLSNK